MLSPTPLSFAPLAKALPLGRKGQEQLSVPWVIRAGDPFGGQPVCTHPRWGEHEDGGGDGLAAESWALQVSGSPSLPALGFFPGGLKRFEASKSLAQGNATEMLLGLSPAGLGSGPWCGPEFIQGWVGKLKAHPEARGLQQGRCVSLAVLFWGET